MAAHCSPACRTASEASAPPAIAAVMRSAKSSSSAISWWTEKISASASPSSALAFS